MTPEQEKLALDLIHNPPPGSALAAAKEFGVDLTLLISALQHTTTERARALAAGARLFDTAKRIPRRAHQSKNRCRKASRFVCAS